MSQRPCPHCGHPVSSEARFCGQCGKTIEAPSLGQTVVDAVPAGALADAAKNAAPVAAKTLMETMNDPHAQERARRMLDEALDKSSKEPAKPAALGKTMLLGGEQPVAPTVPDAPPLSAASPAPVNVAGANRTMLGMSAHSLPGAAPPAPAPAPPGAPAQPGPLRTMLGVAMPGIAPVHASAPEPTPAPPNANRPQGTLLGVAIPGIAPSHAPMNAPMNAPPMPMNASAPNVAQRAGTRIGFPAQQPMAPPPPIVPAPAPLVDEPLPEAPRLPAKRGVPAIVVVLIVIGIVAAAGGAALVLLRGGPTLTATPQLDENGRESLDVGCPSCPDGTTVALGASSAQIKAGKAVLPLPAPLSIGDNDLEVKIDRPGSGRDETVKVHVPVAYRVRADMTTLAAKPPAITVRVEAVPGSVVSVEGKPVSLDPSGRGSYAIDLSKDVEGTSDEQKTIERKIAFAITPKGGKPESGQLTARAGVVPLHLDAPGRLLYTDQNGAAVSGQTRPGGSLSVDGQAAPVDSFGRFGVRVQIDQPGEKDLEIVASAPPLAPRIAHAKVVRVASLDAAEKDLEGKGGLGYDAFASDPAANVGKDVVVDGDIVESRAVHGYTVLLVDATKCAAGKGACLVRVVRGEEMPKAARGQHVRAYGVVTGSVAASGKTVPDVDASLVVVKGGK